MSYEVLIHPSTIYRGSDIYLGAYEFIVLDILVKHGGTFPESSVWKCLKDSGVSNYGRIIKRIVEKGLVEVKNDTLVITDLGVELYNRAKYFFRDKVWEVRECQSI